MSRVPGLDLMTLTDEQRRVYDEIAATRGGIVGGSFPIWLRIPNLAEAQNRLGNALRLDGKLDRALFELVVLLVAHEWSAHFMWQAHENAARAEGLDDSVIEAIKSGRPLSGASKPVRIVYAVVREILGTKKLSQATYNRALAALGLENLIEIISSLGFYTTGAMMITSFEAPSDTVQGTS
jgi:4-carboxymuconolactone decarboxylase